RSNGAAVISFGHHDAAITRHEMIGMNEVGVQAVSSSANPRKQGMIVDDCERVPTHVRDFQRSIRRLDGLDLAFDPTKPRCLAKFQPARRHKLHADADAEKWAPMLPDRILERLAHAGNAVEAPLTVR